MKKLYLLPLLLVANLFAQQTEQAKSAAVSFLLIPADARAAGMGDSGVATAPDVYSQQWNAAKYPFSDDKLGVGVSYTPYLTNITKDVFLFNINFFNKINERSAFAIGLRYFDLGNIVLKEDETDTGQTVNPNEFAIDGSYSLKLSKKFSMAVTGRYIRSDLKIQEVNTTSSAASTVAADISGYFKTAEVSFKKIHGIWRAGFNLSNLGPKLDYNVSSGYKAPLPANLKIGAGFDFLLDPDNTLATTLELNRLLVEDSEGLAVGFGLEYLFRNFLALRSGFANDRNEISNRNYFTFGFGLKCDKVKIDLSYLNSLKDMTTPLDDIFRISMSFNLGEKTASL